jgi:hypothetical protein
MPPVLRSRLTYANIVATLALLFTMTGGAYAAGRYLITSTKQISPKVVKALQGAKGANGSAGPAGPVGPTGPQGPAGSPGAKGDNGTNGTNGENGKEGEAGKNGKSVTIVESATEIEGHCVGVGGSKFEAAGGTKTYACNGKEGTPGPPGPEGNIKGTLAAGETETGVWSFSPSTVQQVKRGRVKIPLSFLIPLSKPLVSECEEEPGEICQIHFINIENEEVTPQGPKVSTECKGTVEEPSAEPGNLCIYSQALGANTSLFKTLVTQNPEKGAEEPGAGTTGALLVFKVTAEEEEGDGTWAVREAG